MSRPTEFLKELRAQRRVRRQRRRAARPHGARDRLVRAERSNKESQEVQERHDRRAVGGCGLHRGVPSDDGRRRHEVERIVSVLRAAHERVPGGDHLHC